ncbi:MAG: DRTGG domain-containing protein [Eubacteriales bacterium]|nr:DRTGG domain-containing protein [Eubacteriales bacterium]
MTVYELCESEHFTPLSVTCAERTVSGVYIGDLLSWVMGKAGADEAWITIMSNINTLAVASLTDVACVILAEGVTLEEDVLKAAKEKEINVVSTDLSAYEAALYLSKNI